MPLFIIALKWERVEFLYTMKMKFCLTKVKEKSKQNNARTILQQEGHDGPEIAHLSLLTKHAPSSFPVT